MLLHEIITEAKVKAWDSVSVDAQKAFALLNEHCKSGLNSIANGSVLWRGDNKNLGAYTAIDTSTGIRTSKDTNNLYQLLMDNSPNLKDVPSRSNSLICSLSKSNAQAYGHYMYAAFPADGTKIAVSNEEDFIHQSVQIFGDSLNLRHGLSVFPMLVKAPMSKKFKSIDELNEYGRKIPWEILQDRIVKRFGEPDEDELDFVEYFKRNKDQLFSALAKDFISKGNLRLYVAEAGELIENDDAECWFSGKAVLIEVEVFRSILREMKRLGMKVSSRYK